MELQRYSNMVATEERGGDLFSLSKGRKQIGFRFSRGFLISDERYF